MEFIAVRRDVGPNQVVDLDGLFVANERNNSDTQRLACVILSVFGLLHHGREQRSDVQGFLTIDLTVAAGSRNAMCDSVRPQSDAACIAQGLDATVVGNHVAELDDLRNAPEMFNEACSATERLARKIVD